MLDPFISHKEEIIEYLKQFDSLPHQENKPDLEMKNPEKR
jgi:hypothetical protein